MRHLNHTDADAQVVPPWSAIVPGTVNADTVEIRKNHRTMVQFNSASDNDFITIATYLFIMSEKAPVRIQSNWEEWENTKSTFLLGLILDTC
jgi:hypothetical protein